MRIWLQFAWSYVIRQLGKAAFWDLGRFLGLPMAIDPRDGHPDRAITPQIFALQVAELAAMMDSEYRPIQGTKAGIRIIFRGLVLGPCLSRFQLWRTRRQVSKMAGLKFKTNQSATAFLKFMAAELEKQQRKEPQA